MPDFNKGDFTQQGVDGHVTTTVRLNEKRIVNLDLTSNETSEGVTVTGTVTDKLNNKTYPIGSGSASGTIEISSNGNYDVSNFRSAEVNVEGGSIPACTINITPGSIITALPGGSVFGLDENYKINETDTLPVTILGVYEYSYMHSCYYVYSLDGRETMTSSYTDTFFTNLVNCSIETSVDGEFTYFGIKITDPTLPSSLTMNADALYQQFE